MKIYLPRKDDAAIGGGWTFQRNFVKHAQTRAQFVSRWEDCDVFFIASPTLADKEEVRAARRAGKQIVLRVDNIVKDSRNRGTGISKMKLFSSLADVVVYQSEWAQQYAGYICGPGTVVYNGVDKSVFTPNGDKVERHKSTVNLFVQYNRDENKRQYEAFYAHHMEQREDKDMELMLVGRFSPELVEYGFDFFDGETITYHGEIQDRALLAKIMRSCDYILYPSFADACPNTLAEALCCGCKPKLINPIGGQAEIVRIWEEGGIDAIPSVQDMVRDYLAIFDLAINTKTVET